ncbi:RagB/SusD family nutrient uptake outer membrane protein [Pedobacter frigoris]|uniref:RagB/SusD family nutrient uptake outer membrane protein n=1 Tax=Pedobacter frigoris TaxID=2571272 RepID=A0A4U1CDI9_9SPHI|nr:RagB/SusD family nutrient uptake outer membrane protein [Pedobacter frigoris]TKC04392.1 RagB/SusD family nutrient uptake outer membrane protein [Pedobacter frigoris]
MKTLYKFLTMGVVLIGAYGCKKELNAPPKNAKVEGNTILDQATSQIALNGAYYNFANANNISTDWQQHQILPAEFAGYLGYGFGASPSEENMTEGSSGTYWNESYKALNSTNGVIKGVNELADNKFTGNRKKEVIAEAKFIRAYAHFKLLSYYAEWYKIGSTQGVLLRDELSTLTNIIKKRSTVKESYDFIIADINEAIANGPSSNPNHYATKWAAMVLKMRVLMSRAGTGDYAEVITLADNIMQNSPYVLEASQQSLFHTIGLASKEVILGVKPQALQPTDPYSKTRQYFPGASALYVAKGALKDLYANDPRGSWVIGTANPNAQYSPNTFYFNKYNAQGVAPSALTETDYAMRLTEVYLLKAEAIVRSGGSLATAKTLIHQIQAKAGITAISNNFHYLAVEAANTPDAVLLELYKETSKSMVGEDGSEWMALLRFPLSVVTQLKPTITTQTQYIIPVPKGEFIYNPQFGEQNTGYSAN